LSGAEVQSLFDPLSSLQVGLQARRVAPAASQVGVPIRTMTIPPPP
jgi:hypothetical protein